MHPPRWRRPFSWARRRPWTALGLAFLTAFGTLNGLAFLHARAMLTFADGAVRTPPPQEQTPARKLHTLAFGVAIPRPENTRGPADVGLAAETVRFAAADGLALEGWLTTPPAPRGTALLFHGYAASRASLLEQGRAFHDHGWATLLVDFRGSGGSDGRASTVGCREALDVAAAVRFAGDRGLPRPLVLYGTSMGASAVLRAVANGGVRPDGVIVEAVFARLLTSARNRFEMMGAPAFPGAELLIFWGGVQAGFDGFAHNPVDYARAVDCPALVLHGAADRHAKPDEGRAVHDGLAGPRELVLFEGAAHGPLVRADRDRWAAAVGRFLAGVGRRE